MKEKELRAAAVCANCGNKVGHTGLPIFWRLTISRLGLDLRTIQRQDALASFLGSSELANVMGTDEEMTVPLIEPFTITICENCAHDSLFVGELAERQGSNDTR